MLHKKKAEPDRDPGNNLGVTGTGGESGSNFGSPGTGIRSGSNLGVTGTGGGTRGTMVGGASILAVFAVLCLAVFALLTLLRAESDLRLSRKTAEVTEAYYQADSQGEKRVAALLPTFRQSLGKTQGERNEAMEAAAKQQKGDYDRKSEEITFRIPVSAGQFLTVVMKPTDRNPYYEIITWKEENRSEYDSQQSLPIWDGTDHS